MPKGWLKLDPTQKALAKCLSDFITKNLFEDFEYLKSIKLTVENAENWLGKLFEDRVFLNIHSFQKSNNKSFRVTYEIPISIRQSIYNQNPIANDKKNLYNQTDLLSIKIVIEFPYNRFTQSYQKDKGTLVNLFVHNNPYKDDEMESLLKNCPNIVP